MAIKKAKKPKGPVRKADNSKDRFDAVGGGPNDGVLYLARLKTDTYTTTLPDEIPYPNGTYQRVYDPEQAISTYVWKDA